MGYESHSTVRAKHGTAKELYRNAAARQGMARRRYGKEKIMKFLDFFAGIGGFRRGMELAGHECVGFCEFDKFATASYTSMHLITDEQREYLATLDIKKDRRRYSMKNTEMENGTAQIYGQLTIARRMERDDETD